MQGCFFYLHDKQLLHFFLFSECLEKIVQICCIGFCVKVGLGKAALLHNHFLIAKHDCDFPVVINGCVNVGRGWMEWKRRKAAVLQHSKTGGVSFLWVILQAGIPVTLTVTETPNCSVKICEKSCAFLASCGIVGIPCLVCVQLHGCAGCWEPPFCQKFS